MTDSETNETALAHPTDAFHALDHWFDDLASRVGEAAGFYSVHGLRGFPRLPKTDILETPTGYQIVTELPGITKEQLDLKVKGTTVEIRAKSTTEVASEGPVYLHQERRRAEFERYVELPEPVIAEKAKATLREGLLTLDLPKEHPVPVPTEVQVRIE